MLTKPSLMTFASRTQFHVYLPWGQRPFSIVSNSVLNVKALVGAFNHEKAFSVIVKPVVEPMDHFTALITSRSHLTSDHLVCHLLY